MAQERLGDDRWRFTLEDHPPTSDERRVLLPDLRRQGLDESLLDLFAAAAAAGPDDDDARTRLLLLRGFDGDELAGLTPVLECRVVAHHYLSSRVGARLVEALDLTCWYWDRTSAGVDGHTCPGLVAHAVDRETFAEAGLRWLARRYAAGVVVEPLGAPARRTDVVSSFAPAALLRLSLDPRLGSGYAELGGEVVVHRGPLPAAEHAELAELVRAHAARSTLAQLRRPLGPALRALWAAGSGVHVLGRRDGSVDCFASFLRSGEQLLLVAGTAASSPGADDAVLAEVSRTARQLGCTSVQMGPALNGDRAPLVRLRPSRMRFVSRWPHVRAALRVLVPRSLVSPGSFVLATAGITRPRSAPAPRRAGDGHGHRPAYPPDVGAQQQPGSPGA